MTTFLRQNIERMGLPHIFGRPNLDIVDNSGDKHDKQLTSGSSSSRNQALTNLNEEATRLKTFENWNIPFIDKHQLALLGFYYFGPNDLVKCAFCGVEIGMWEEGDDVLTDHMRWSPSCIFINRNRTNNVPINEALLNQILPPPPSRDVYINMDRFTNNTVSEGSIESVSEDDVHMYQHSLFGQGGIEAVLRGDNISTIKPTIARPEFPEYAVEAKRVESFADWPKLLKQRPQELSDAGFYYTGKGDKVCCFSCGGGLKDWEEFDDPWEQHAMWYGKCEYLKLLKGDEYIKQMELKRNEKTRQNSSGVVGPCSSPSSSSQASSLHESHSTSSEKLSQEASEKSDEEEERKESKLCKICYVNEYNTIFIPCGHVIACAKCASSVEKCPACRQPFDNVMRVFFS